MLKNSYLGDGVTTEFVFSFPFFQIADIHVAINDVEMDAGFSVIPNSDLTGGTIVFDVAPIENTNIDIFRRVSLSRVIDYQPTMKIDPENLNADFNFILAAFHDIYGVNVDLSEWANVHDNIRQSIDYTLSVISDKIGGGAVLGLYNNLMSVLDGALPKLINDYGFITDSVPNENHDDYGIL